MSPRRWQATLGRLRAEANGLDFEHRELRAVFAGVQRRYAARLATLGVEAARLVERRRALSARLAAVEAAAAAGDDLDDDL